MLTAAGRDPSVLVGGIAANFGGGYRLGGGREFVIEGDEYDSAFFDKTAKFLKYLPDIAIVNNIEFDHADIYPDMDAVELAFKRLAVLVPRNGLLLLGADSPRAAALGGARRAARSKRFGLTGDADVAAHTTCASSAARHGFKVARHGEHWSAPSSCRSSARTTCATRWRPSPSAHTVGLDAERSQRDSRRFRA